MTINRKEERDFMNRKWDKRSAPPQDSRLMSLLASLFFSIPTAFLIWLAINREIAFLGGFVSATYLWAMIAGFALVALLSPALFPSLMGAIWHGMLRIYKWLGW